VAVGGEVLLVLAKGFPVAFVRVLVEGLSGALERLVLPLELKGPFVKPHPRLLFGFGHRHRLHPAARGVTSATATAGAR
jgi:hypothetical protein